MSVALKNTDNEEFVLTPDNTGPATTADVLELELFDPSKEAVNPPVQAELFLPETHPEQPEDSPQIEFEGMPKPVYAVHMGEQQMQFQHANNLLESLESQGADAHYQCREGYCGSCRVRLLEGEVHYIEEPMAWVNDDEILLCCCIPRSNLKIQKI